MSGCLIAPALAALAPVTRKAALQLGCLNSGAVRARHLQQLPAALPCSGAGTARRVSCRVQGRRWMSSQRLGPAFCRRTQPTRLACSSGRDERPDRRPVPKLRVCLHAKSNYRRFFFDFYPVCRRFEAAGSRSWRRRNIRTCPGLRGGMQCRAKPEAGGELSLYSLPV